MNEVARSRGEHVQAISAVRLRAVAAFSLFAARCLAGRLSVSKLPCWLTAIDLACIEPRCKARLRPRAHSPVSVPSQDDGSQTTILTD